MAPPEVVNLAERLATFADHWNPRIVGRYNGNELRVARLQGEFTWHRHTDTDELFLVLAGQLSIRFRDGVRTFGPGELVVVPAGTEHQPVAEAECQVLLIDREGEPNTGDAPSHLTRERLDAI